MFNGELLNKEKELAILRAKAKRYMDKNYKNDDGSYKIKRCKRCHQEKAEYNFFITVSHICKECVYRITRNK